MIGKPSPILLPVIFLLGSAAFFSCKPEKAKAPAANPAAGRNAPLQVEAFVVRAKLLSENLEVPGTLLPFEETEIRPEISGRLVSLNVQEGGAVQKGALLAKLFDEDLQAQLKKLQVQLEIAKQTLERQQSLLKIQGISQQEVDLSELQVNNIKADIELVRVSISKTEIRAPYSGILGLRNVSLGAYVSPTTLITTLRQVSQLKLDFTVPEKYGEMFRKGRTINFTVAGNKRLFSASVIATEAAVDVSTRSLTVRALVKGMDNALLPGIFAKVQLNMGGNEKSLIVPTQAVIPQARNKQVIVFKNGAPDFRIVDTGIRDSSYVQILEGLKEGDTIVTTGLLAIRPDSKLVLSKVE
ncbi:MAG: efflux RND transporter periplasmic adaptor subunit [Lewinellaceae bacterium]|nr:efflux RND transporter periplasmic adaptor subunit [Saprospiraceae bacterium]MCB9341570.1 efflux RND transporter periplasmic adaptor subunit [Lewinellaceae bacterium]